MPGYQRQTDTDEFHLFPLACCLRTSGDLPHGNVPPCKECGISTILPPPGSCACLSEAQLETKWTWLKRKDTLEGKDQDQVKKRLRRHTGTIGELLQSIQDDYKPFLLHRWLCRFIRRQFDLDCENFDGETEVICSWH